MAARRKMYSLIILLLLLSANAAAIVPVLAQSTSPDSESQQSAASAVKEPSVVPFTFTVYGKDGLRTYTTQMPFADAQAILASCRTLANTMVSNPQGTTNPGLQDQLLTTLLAHHAIPQEIKDNVLAVLRQTPRFPFSSHESRHLTQFNSQASEWLCSFASAGDGSSLPIIILPRFIPFILTPIPRVIMRWNADYAVTSCGALRSSNGFIAEGAQSGIALGFWGIGFTVHLPPFMNTYGLFGYAVYSHVTSDYIEFYPPNNPPEISGSDPADGQTDVPVALSELRFRLADADGDLMSYNVTTIPDIGSGSGGLKPDGVYSLPVSGLKELTKYSWTVSVSDGKDTTTQTYSFTTEGVSPIVSNPRPFDGEKEVQTDLTELRFTLQDPQHDFMSYTVQTSPDIGSASATNVAGGTYTVPVNGLTIGTLYHWYINATDGTHWTRMVLSFTSGYPSHFNPYDYGWQYRKQITIDHTKVTEPLTNFTVLISITDSDLTKAQSDGGDILFMDNTGSAVKIHHEIDVFDSSTGTLAAWVQVPELSSTTDTVFYMYYGNPTCVDQAYPQETWDSSYLAVWHMGDATTSTITDSTNNDNTGTKGVVNGPTEQGGVTGTSQDFDGTDDYIQFTTPIIPTGPKTVTGWIKRHTTADYGVVLATSTGISSLDRGTAWTMIPGNDKKMQCFLGNDEYGSHYMTVYITIPDLTNWHYYAMTYDGTTLQMYLDGSSDVSTTTKVGSETPPDYNLRMGKTNHPSYVYPLDGTLDDITISDVPRSIGWVQTSYQTMSDPAHFFTEGPEEHGP